MGLIVRNPLARRAWELWREQGFGSLVRRGAQFARYHLKRWMRKNEPRNLLLSAKTALGSYIILAWWHETTNFGDALNPILIKFLAGREPVHSSRIFNIANKPVYTVIGSILQKVGGKRLVVWGSGFTHADDRLRQAPERVLAVRGPLTRQKMLSAGIDCPEVYGDPALLCPLLYQPDMTKTHRLGIIPHYVDKGNSLVERFLQDPEVRLIDIQGGIYNVIDEINQCELIASSSLHGMIVADAYGVPSLWIRLSNKILGGDFKFKDYLASVGREVVRPLVITEGTTLAELFSHFQEYEIHIDLDKLLEACPFRHHDNK